MPHDNISSPNNKDTTADLGWVMDYKIMDEALSLAPVLSSILVKVVPSY